MYTERYFLKQRVVVLEETIVLDPSPRDFPSSWASQWGEDQFGLWQSLCVDDQRLIMRWIPPGEFLMGSPENENGRYENETQHPVILTKGFWLGETTVTAGFWSAVQGGKVSDKNRAMLPKVNASWNDCQKWLDVLSAQFPGLAPGLPTEAQWEYACRAGTNIAYWWGDEFNSKFASYRSGLKMESPYPANAFGLRSMNGNVWEWCEDRYGAYERGSAIDPTGPVRGNYRVLRGGSWISSGLRLRAADRFIDGPGWRDDNFGFRLAGGI